MDEDSLRNWSYYDPEDKANLALQLMSSVAERDTKPFLPGHDNLGMVQSSNCSYHPQSYVVTESPVPHMDYDRNSWINPGEKFLHMFRGNNQNLYRHPVIPESSGLHYHPVQMVHHHQPVPTKENPLPGLKEEPVTTIKKEHGPIKKETGPANKRASAPKIPNAKKPRKRPAPKENGDSSSDNTTSSIQRSKRNVEVVINGIDMDITGIPIPVCSCTGTPQQCYRWGCGSWQSACCTTTICMYPLPMNTKRRGARIAGRKMSQGAFKKVLEKLAAEGYDFGNSPIDLRTYWAKHGTNKFVIIR